MSKTLHIDLLPRGRSVRGELFDGPQRVSAAIAAAGHERQVIRELRKKGVRHLRRLHQRGRVMLRAVEQTSMYG